MAPGAALLLVLGSGLATACSGETLNASKAVRGSGDGEGQSMMDALRATTSKILPGANPAEVLPGVGDALGSLSKIYDGAAMQPFAISVNQAEVSEAFRNQDSSAAIYGELVPPSAAAMMEYALKSNPNIVWDGKEHYRYEVKDQASEQRPKFLDLGSGFGKISALAALLGFDAGGYEMTRPRIDSACGALDKLAGRASSDVTSPLTHDTEATGTAGADQDAEQNLSPHERCALEASHGHGSLKFFMGSFTHPSVSLSDADVIFTDSVFWNDRMMSDLGEKASLMKPGSIIISYKAFPGKSFTTLGTLRLPTSWSGGTEYQVQQVVKSLRGRAS